MLVSFLLGVLAVAQASHAHGHGESGHHHFGALPRGPARTADREAELHRLFRRASTAYPAADQPGPTPLAAWMATYTKAKAAGLIPTFAPSLDQGGTAVYPPGVNGNDNTLVCSWTVTNCNATTDIVNAPDGMIGISFDDGPQPDAVPLYTFLSANNIPSTHFMIGSRILDNPSLFKSAIRIGSQIAVHTWSHPLMTTLTDEQVVGELGWTMQIIYQNTGGMLPQFWRPPYGDVDNRVRAIARQVFGLTTVIWNQDTNDWCLNDDGTNACPNNPSAPTTEAQLAKELTTFLTGSKSPGLIILEHEHKARAVTGFMNTAWPLIQSQNWQYENIAGLFNLQYYANAANDTAPIATAAIAVNPIASAVPLANIQLASHNGSAQPSGVSSARSLLVTSTSSVSLSASLASMSAVALAAQSPPQTTSKRRLSTGAITGIAIGSLAGAALLAVLATCVLIRCRRDKQARGGPDVAQHPYNTMLESPSALTFDEKEAFAATAAAIAAPNQLYVPPTANAAVRKSTASLYSQQDPQESSTLGAYFLSGNGGTERPARAASKAYVRPATQRFHLPTSMVNSGGLDSPQGTPEPDREGWL